jgi:outer membrane immunogenic protein
MNKLIASLGIFAVASLNPAYAAPPAPLAVPAWSWTGFYVGVNVGGSWGRSETDANLSDPFFTGAVLFATPIDFNMNGVIGGGQIGYNWQSGTWVLGIEADIQGSGQKGSAFFTCSTVICNPRADQPETSMASATLEQRLQWFGTLRARAGATVYPWLLVYVTGGLAYGAIKSDSTLTGFTEVGPPAPPKCRQH